MKITSQKMKKSLFKLAEHFFFILRDFTIFFAIFPFLEHRVKAKQKGRPVVMLMGG